MNRNDTIELDYEIQERGAVIPVNSIFYSALDKIPELASNFMICIAGTFEKKLKTGKVLKDEDIAIQTSLTRSVEDWDLELKLRNALKKIHPHDEMAEASVSLDSLGTRGGHFAPSVLIFLALWFPPFLFTP